MDNPDVRRYVLSYPNEKTRMSVAQTIYDFIRELRKTEPDFNINNLLDMDGIAAREKIWSVIMSYIEREKYRTAGLLKVYLKLFYDYVHELRRDNQIVLWKRRHQVPDIRTKKTEVPNHEQIYRLTDKTTHLRIQSIILLSYSSGLKGAGIINLRVGDLREAIEFRDRLKQEFINEKNRTTDPKAQKDLDELINNSPLIIKITSEIYFKRFRNGSSEDWYPALVCRDAEELLMKYYNIKRKDASDSESLFVTGIGRKLTQVELSKSLGYNIKKFFKSTGELENTSPSLLRRSFYNRLIAGNMKDIHREFLMGHALGVKGHYFDWESNKKEILLSYIRCNFNRMANDVTREISSLKEDSMSKDEKIKRLEEELLYFKSPQFTKDLISEIKTTSFIPEVSKKPVKTHQVKVKLDDGKKLAEYMRKGYSPIYSDNEIWVLEKETEEE